MSLYRCQGNRDHPNDDLNCQHHKHQISNAVVLQTCTEFGLWSPIGDWGYLKYTLFSWVPPNFDCQRVWLKRRIWDPIYWTCPYHADFCKDGKNFVKSHCHDDKNTLQYRIVLSRKFKISRNNFAHLPANDNSTIDVTVAAVPGWKVPIMGGAEAAKLAIFFNDIFVYF